MFSADKPDHQILNCAYTLSRQNPETRYVMVTKDVNLRMKAKAVGLMAEDYKNDQVKDVSRLYTGKRILEDVATDIIDELYNESSISLEALGLDPPLYPNESLIMRNHRKSALAIYDPFLERVRLIQKTPIFNITPRNAEQTFALQMLLNPNISLVSLSGKAGTGKTLLALVAALQQQSQYRQI
jgi:PhoH-like ATPase